MGEAMHAQKAVSLAAGKRKSVARAYVLLSTVEGRSADVVNALLQNRDVLSVDKVEGPPDIVAIIEAPSRTKLASAVVKALSSVEVMVDSVDLLPV